MLLAGMPPLSTIMASSPSFNACFVICRAFVVNNETTPTIATVVNTVANKPGIPEKSYISKPFPAFFQAGGLFR